MIFLAIMVSLSVTQFPPSCPSSVIQNYQCPYETGQYIFDLNGCLRKICPSMSRLCDVRKREIFVFSNEIVLFS